MKNKRNVGEFLQKLRISFASGMESVQDSGKALLLMCIAAIIVMGAVCVGIFFAAVKGSEEVLVPDVTGKPLTEAVQAMQVKELFPRIQMRYSDVPGDEGTVLEQNPVAGAIVKASRHIDLVVSRGVVIDQVEDYTGMKLEELNIKLQTLFSGASVQLIKIGETMYIADTSDAGTILEQDPLPGTQISEPVTLKLVVSRGPSYERTRVPSLVGMSVNDVLAQLSRSKITFDFTAEYLPVADLEEGKTGCVISQQQSDEFVVNYSRLSAVFEFPEEPVNGNLYGLFTAVLPEYPYPLSMHLDAETTDGEQYTLTTFNHPGGNLTIPYEVPAGTKLTLFVEGRATTTLTVR